MPASENLQDGAGNGTRTRNLQLGRLPLYQLSYSRISMVAREGFEPSKAEPTDLQSAPFDRSGISPHPINNTGDCVLLQRGLAISQSLFFTLLFEYLIDLIYTAITASTYP